MPFHELPCQWEEISVVPAGQPEGKERFAVVAYINGNFVGASKRSGSLEWANALRVALMRHDTFGDICDLMLSNHVVKFGGLPEI